MKGDALNRNVFAVLTAAIFLALTNPAPGQEPALNEIVRNIEIRYEIPGFTADFHQVSTIKAMEIEDEARGKMYVRRPGMMRWEYESPESQIIITNGNRLWIYRPEDNQVMLGKAPAFFGDGKGAGFLADIKVLRKKFSITPAASDDALLYGLKLEPVEDSLEVKQIFLFVSKQTYAITRVITVNAYDDQTRIEMINSRFDTIPDRSLFTFTIPEGTDVLTLDE